MYMCGERGEGGYLDIVPTSAHPLYLAGVKEVVLQAHWMSGLSSTSPLE